MDRTKEGGSDKRRLLALYCDAWNRWDLDALFALFHEDAVYHGQRRVLRGRNAIRRMYEESHARGQVQDLEARVEDLPGGDCGVALWRRAKVPGQPAARVAVKRFTVEDGRIRAHDLREL